MPLRQLSSAEIKCTGCIKSVVWRVTFGRVRLLLIGHTAAATVVGQDKLTDSWQGYQKLTVGIVKYTTM